MKNVLLICKKNQSAWTSCIHITSNLQKSYEQAFGKEHVSYLHLSGESNYSDHLTYIEKIAEFKPDKVVWVDHKPNPAKFLKAFLEISKIKKELQKIEIDVHLFGDFILDSSSWFEIVNELSELKIKLIVASDRQKELVKSLLVGSDDIVHVMAFPVDENKFHSSELSKEKLRSKYKINTDSYVFIYSGRISLQKKLDQVIKSLADVRKITNIDILLLVAGPWDDILLPYLGTKGMPGSYFNQFNLSLKDVDLSFVKFLGNLNTESLREYYQLSDKFISFSTYNDEDYGMAVAESLMCGTGAILSNWGGYSSFKKYFPDEVKLVDVKINENGPIVNLNLGKKILIETVLDSKKESGLLKDASKTLGIDGIAQKILDLDKIGYEKNKLSASELFVKLYSRFKFQPYAPFKEKGIAFTKFYFDIYRVYSDEK